MPLFSVKRVRVGNVYGEPRWEAGATAKIVEQLALIPAARIFHQAGPADHVVVVGTRAAIIAGPPAVQIGDVTTRAWPATIRRDPHRAVEEIGAWLLHDNDGRTVDRQALAAVANL